MFERPRANVKVEGGSPFTFTRNILCITSILFYGRKIHVRMHVKITRQYMRK